MTIKANLVDIKNKNIYAAEITVLGNKISNVLAIDEVVENYILPGFIDAHIHIESSMLVPSAFAKIAVQHGTVATVSDPHEIANVCGMQGVQYMIDNGNKVNFKFNFGAPSCVPATNFETSGAVLNAQDVKELLAKPEIKYLSEMMNYPGVLFEDKEVMAKIAAAKFYNKPIDGHAPGLMGEDAIKYINAGIITDHECYTLAEAEHKLKHGMKVLIREGSAAKNFEALWLLMHEHFKNMMFCCDDKHPDELLLHHINHHVKRAVANGVDVFKVLQVACINPVEHYKLDVGLLQINDAADFIIVNNLKDFEIINTFIDGKKVFDQSNVLTLDEVEPEIINNFNCLPKSIADFEIEYHNQATIKVIEAIEGQLITQTFIANPKVENNKIIADIENDILQIAVVNRYNNAPVANAFIKNFGLQKGAIASTVGHDCHNIIVVGTNAQEMCNAANKLIEMQGGVCANFENKFTTLALPIAGLMSNKPIEIVAKNYEACNDFTKQLGCTLQAPFMTLSFMALLVIPQLKLSDLGLFDGGKFEFVDL
jgi:adenine deaminase